MQDVSGRECKELWLSDSTRLRGGGGGGRAWRGKAEASGRARKSGPGVRVRVRESSSLHPMMKRQWSPGVRASERACEEGRPSGWNRSRACRLAVCWTIPQ